MVVPENTELIDYSSIFSFSSVSAIGKSIYVPESNRRNLEEVEEHLIIFTWEVTEHTPTKVVILLDFEDPASISNSVYGRDVIVLKILKLSHFVSSETGEHLTVDHFNQ